MEKQTQSTPMRGSARQNQRRSRTDLMEIDLLELFLNLLWHWKLLILGLLIGSVIGGVFHVLTVRPRYKATTELYITSSDSIISLQDLQIGTLLAEDYRSIIMSRPVLNAVIKDLDLDMNYQQLGTLIGVSNPTGTHIIRSSVTTHDASLSRDIANSLLEVSIDQIFEIVGTSQPTIIDYSAVEAVVDVSPSLTKYILLGAAIGLVMVCMILTLLMLMNSTIKTEADVERYLHKPVLSTIPYYEE